MLRKTESEVCFRSCSYFDAATCSGFAEYYLARPFNFNLSPLHADGVDFKNFKMDRRFEFSSSACDFLHKNNFDFGKVFNSGVPYLSREEEAELRKRESQRADENAKIPVIGTYVRCRMHYNF